LTCLSRLPAGQDSRGGGEITVGKKKKKKKKGEKNRLTSSGDKKATRKKKNQPGRKLGVQQGGPAAPRKLDAQRKKRDAAIDVEKPALQE